MRKAHITLQLAKGDTPKVALGDKVSPGNTLVSYSSGELDEFNLAKLLGVKGAEIKKFLLVKEGEKVETHAVIAKKGGVLKKHIIKTPTDGIFTIVDPEKGIVGIRKETHKEDVTAWFSGQVVEATPEKLVFELTGHSITAKEGKGKPVSGNLLFIAEVIDVFNMPIDLENRVLAVRELHPDMIAKADALGVVAIIAETITQPPFELPYVLLEDISHIKGYTGKSVIVYGDEKQLLIVEEEKKK